MNYIKKDKNATPVLGIGKKERMLLSKLLRNTTETISIAEAAQILNMPVIKVSNILGRLRSKGWLSRISSGVYVVVPLEAETSEIVPEDLFVIGAKLFDPCYIGGWSAAEYWGMTEQIFNTVIVISQKVVRNHRPIIKQSKFIIRTVKPSSMFGLKTIWRSNVAIKVSDRERTLLDMLILPQLGGGIRSVNDILNYYMRSKNKNIERLTEYIIKLKNGAVCKRLGFLIEKDFPEEKDLLSTCKERMSTGYAKLDNTLECDKLLTKWNLWIPKAWKEGFYDQQRGN